MRIITTTITTLILSLAGCTGEIVSEGGDQEGAEPPVQATAHSAIGLPDPGTLGSPEEGYGDYQADFDSVSACNNGEMREGMSAFANYLGQFGIVAHNYASCQTGFHPRGQALDVYVSGFDGKQAFADWLTANDNEMARRLGVVQIVWNKHIWRAYNGGPGKPQGQFSDYFGSNPHTDHVHLSFDEAAAEGATSFFSEVINGGGGGGGGGDPTHSTFTECGWLHVNQVIGTDAALPSCDNRFIFAMQTDGNLVLYRTADGFPKWSSGTAGSGARLAVMQGDGNFVTYTPGGSPVWDTATGFSGTELAVQTDGNVVLYFFGQPAWNTGTSE